MCVLVVSTSKVFVSDGIWGAAAACERSLDTFSSRGFFFAKKGNA